MSRKPLAEHKGSEPAQAKDQAHKPAKHIECSATWGSATPVLAPSEGSFLDAKRGRTWMRFDRLAMIHELDAANRSPTLMRSRKVK